LSSALEDGRNYRLKHVELIEFNNKLLLLRLVGCLYYCIRDTRSHKHQICGLLVGRKKEKKKKLKNKNLTELMKYNSHAAK